MMKLSRVAAMAVLCAAAALVPTSKANAGVVVGFSFGSGDVAAVIGSPCYGAPVCSYPLYYEPVFVDGAWYRGPIYYRWSGGVRLFWYHGTWRRDEWRGPRPARIEWRSWREHGDWHDGWRGDREWHERVARAERGNAFGRDRARFEDREDRRDRGRQGHD
jgi:hypothetical protein